MKIQQGNNCYTKSCQEDQMRPAWVAELEKRKVMLVKYLLFE